MSATLKNGLPISVGLDIGTSKVCALVTSPDPSNNTLKILGIGIAESEGLNRGVVVNIEKTIRSIKKVIEQAEEQSGIKITEVTVGIAGDHIEAIRTRGIIGISNSEQEITQSDVDRLLKDASKIAIPSERKILHVIPQDFIIDGQDGITDPIGMSGIRMEANVNIITGLKTAINNIYRCVERLDIKVKDVILEPIASSKSVLLDAEKEIGVAIIDIGGGTTDVAIFEEGIYRFTSVFALAGKHVTNDIRKVLGIVTNQAEKIKRDYGHCHGDSIMKDEVFMVPGIGGRKPMEIQKSQLCEIIQPRMQELFEFALAEINRSGYANNLGAGIVITGGTALLTGTEELAKEVFGMPVKIGIPTNLSYSGLAPEVGSPVYSTAVGLALNGIGDIHSFEIEDLTQVVEDEEEMIAETPVIKKVEKVEKIKNNTVKNLFARKVAKKEVKEKAEKKGKAVTTTVNKLKKFIEEL
jgi:cell division protein FtsA